MTCSARHEDDASVGALRESAHAAGGVHQRWNHSSSSAEDTPHVEPPRRLL